MHDSWSPPARGAIESSSHRRNTTIDILRGYCIVAMIASHTSTSSVVNQVLHPLRFVSGAEGFVFLSGLVLGLVYRRRLETSGLPQAARGLLRRALQIWGIHCVTVLAAAVASAYWMGYADIPDIREVGLARYLGLTATLRLQPGHMLNILPMYVVFLAAAPLLLAALSHGLALPLLAASTALFAYTQWHPEFGSWVHPLSGGDAFPPAAWQFLFVPGMVAGYHYGWLRDHVVAPARRPLRIGLGALTLATIVMVSVQTPTIELYNHTAWDAFLWERHPLRFGRVLYFLVSVAACYLWVQHLQAQRWRPLMPFRLLETLGRNSLYSFLVHLVVGLAVGMVVSHPAHPVTTEAVPLVTICLVYGMARCQVLRRWIPN